MGGDAALTLTRLLVGALRLHGDRPALRHGELTLSYRELDELSDRLAATLVARGLSRGARIALHLRNCVEYVVADLAILKAAAVKVPLNEFMSGGEVAYCLKHSGAEVLISHTSMPRPPLADAPIALQIDIPDGTGGAPPPGALGWGEVVREPAVPPPLISDAADPAIIMYTGGTTGHPKGVHHLQGRAALNILAHVTCGDIRADEVMLLSTPLPHSAGFFLQACLLQGGTVVLGPRFDAAGFLHVAREVGATWTFAVPTMLYRLLDAIADGGQVPPALRTVVYGAAPMNSVRLRQALEAFGPVFLQLYGQTECPNFITSLPKQDHLREGLHASCGRPVPYLEVRLRNDDGAEAAAGDVGEIEVRSPYQLVDYYGDPQATRASIVDGWLRTGDLAYRNADGYVFLVDRAKDMIITGGLNVYSVEVEAAIREHPAVVDVGVVGVPHADWGEAVVAVVVAREHVEVETLMKFARERISSYKVPKRIVFLDALPLTRYGKPDKKVIRSVLTR